MDGGVAPVACIFNCVAKFLLAMITPVKRPLMLTTVIASCGECLTAVVRVYVQGPLGLPF